MKKIDTICPICKGKGKLELPYKDTKDWIIVRQRMVVDLLKAGYSFRQICKLLKFGSTRSIQIIKKKYGKL